MITLRSEQVHDRSCSAVDQRGAHCPNRADWHILLTPVADGGMPAAELGDTLALCQAHCRAFGDARPDWVMDVHEFEASGGPCGWPGSRWGDGQCELDLITGRELVAQELGLVTR